MKRLLVFGLSGQVGGALQPKLLAAGHHVVAISRTPAPSGPDIEWRSGSLETFVADAHAGYDAVLSLGPLDAFSHWAQANLPSSVAVVALGSTSRHGKLDSPDREERALAQTLAEAEDRLAETCARRGAGLCLLRPTLLYGVGRDRTLTPLVHFARRHGFLPIPARAEGLRQPVHVDDVAGAVLKGLGRIDEEIVCFDLPGGETLSFYEMLRRTIAAGAPEARALPIPRFALSLAAVVVPGLGWSAGFTVRGSVHRLDRDLCYKGEPVSRFLDWQPRGFAPSREMFESHVAPQHEKSR